MKQILCAVTLSALFIGAQAQTSAPSGSTGTQATGTRPAASTPGANVPNRAASANQVGVKPGMGGEQSKGPPKQMKKTEAQSNSSQ